MRAHEFTDQGAAGIVLYAEDTGRYGLQQRSNKINDGGLWAAWGGGREPGETLEQCARRELAEESGYTGPIKLQRLGENSKYVTFLGTVPHEFEPRANDEWQDYCWVSAGDWPSPMHPGVTAALRNIPVAKSINEITMSGSQLPGKWVQDDNYEKIYDFHTDKNHYQARFQIDDTYDDEEDSVNGKTMFAYFLAQLPNGQWTDNITNINEPDTIKIYSTMAGLIQQILKSQPDISSVSIFGRERVNNIYKQLLQRNITKLLPGWQVTSKGIERLEPAVTENIETPQWLYHATYRPLLKSIKAHGLGGDRAQAKWEDSKPGVVYLARDPDVAESYAESSDVVPDEWLDQIIVFKIRADQLDPSRLFADQNVQDNAGDTLEYHGVIPVASLSLTENFADGKVKGKSRPGRVKRAGASCDGSVTSLRAKAKKYSGERGKMYHWCANMKSGKKK